MRYNGLLPGQEQWDGRLWVASTRASAARTPRPKDAQRQRRIAGAAVHAPGGVDAQIHSTRRGVCDGW